MLPPSHEAAAPVANADRRATLILVVEDNAINARLTTHMLKAGGYQAHVASDGQQGLEMARQLLPDLVLTDLQMPGLDGLSLARLLKQDASTAGIPIIALTAHAMLDHREQALEAGCVAFIAKPIRLQSFLTEVSHVLERSVAGR